jgi:hypothetical protein
VLQFAGNSPHIFLGDGVITGLVIWMFVRFHNMAACAGRIDRG